jgi:hypothetical protein
MTAASSSDENDPSTSGKCDSMGWTFARAQDADALDTEKDRRSVQRRAEQP